MYFSFDLGHDKYIYSDSDPCYVFYIAKLTQFNIHMIIFSKQKKKNTHDYMGLKYEKL